MVEKIEINKCYKYIGEDVQILDTDCATAFGTSSNINDMRRIIIKNKASLDFEGNVGFKNGGHIINENPYKTIKKGATLKILNFSDTKIKFELYNNPSPKDSPIFDIFEVVTCDYFDKNFISNLDYII